MVIFFDSIAEIGINGDPLALPLSPGRTSNLSHYFKSILIDFRNSFTRS